MKNVSLVLVLALTACGGDDGGSGGSDIPTTTKLPDLTPAQGKQVCKDVTALFPQHQIDCGGSMMTIGLDITDCDDGTPVGNITPTCTATVLDLENCFSDFSDISDADWCNATVRKPTSCAPLMTPECDTHNQG
jgi:hypothetical protein